MSMQTTSRRGFFRGAGGAAAGTLAGLGVNLQPVAARAAALRVKGATEVPSICPYCAVGCAQIVSVPTEVPRAGQAL